MTQHYITDKHTCPTCKQSVVTKTPIEEMPSDMTAIICVRDDNLYELIMTSDMISKLCPDKELSVVYDTLAQTWDGLLKHVRFAKIDTAIEIASLQGNYSIHRRIDTNPALAEEMKQEFLIKMSGQKKRFSKLKRQAY